jgi:hypothetical protein
MRIRLLVISVPCVAAFVAIAPSSFAQPAPAVAAKPAIARKHADPFLNGPPFKFDQVVRLLRQNAIPLRRRKAAIEHRGLAFSLSPEEIKKLKAAGASEEMMEVIKSKAQVETATLPAVAPPPPPPPPPPKPPAGKLALRCSPGECEVSLNEAPRGATHTGTLEIADLPPGQWTVGLKKQGYLDRQAVVTVEPDRTVSVAEVLTPNRATRETFGTELFQKVRNAIGSPSDKGPVAVEAAGSANTWTCEGRSVRWLLWMRNQPDRALFQVKSGQEPLHEVTFAGSQYSVGKKLKGQEAVQLGTDAGLIRDFQLSALMAKLGSPDFKLLADRTAPVDGEQLTLVAEGKTEKISILLGDDLLPRQAQIATATGNGAGIVSYSDYLKSENIAYPKAMQIKPEGWQHPIEVQFDKVTVRPQFTENDLKPRKKPLSD